MAGGSEYVSNINVMNMDQTCSQEKREGEKIDISAFSHVDVPVMHKLPEVSLASHTYGKWDIA